MNPWIEIESSRTVRTTHLTPLGQVDLKSRRGIDTGLCLVSHWLTAFWHNKQISAAKNIAQKHLKQRFFPANFHRFLTLFQSLLFLVSRFRSETRGGRTFRLSEAFFLESNTSQMYHAFFSLSHFHTWCAAALMQPFLLKW